MDNQTLAGLNLLIMDDDKLLRRRLSAYLQSLGCEISEASTLLEAKNLLSTLSFDLALLDVNLPDGLGFELLQENRFSENTVVVIMTAEGGIDGAVKAIKSGASDYLVKPFEPEEIPLVFSRGRKRKMEGRIQQFAQQSNESEGLIFGSGLGHIKEMISKIIESDSRMESCLPPVLIEGETGTGKTTLARWIHNQGPRRESQLVEINAAALPEKLAEAELFGYEKGAFTDAKSSRMGLFEAATEGSLFIDELASLPLSIQAKILKVIEDNSIRRVGGSKEIPVNSRIIAATNIPLEKAVQSGAFREDLMHRLNLFTIRIPPLRERKQDIPILAEQLLSQIEKKHRKKSRKISQIGVEKLNQHSWPGNVRELIHELERAVVFEDGDQLDLVALSGKGKGTTEKRNDTEEAVLESNHATPHWTQDGFIIPESGFSIETAINDLIQKALDQTKGNVSAAARLLGVNRDYIRYRFEKKKKSQMRG